MYNGVGNSNVIDRHLLVTKNWCILVKDTSACSTVVFRAREIMQLFSVVLCVVRAVHKFHVRLSMNETPNKWRPVESRLRGHTDVCFWQELYVFFRDRSRQC
jgi:hypothetical protein